MSSYNGAKTAETMNDMRRATKKAQRRGVGAVRQATPEHHKVAPDPEIRACFDPDMTVKMLGTNKVITGGNLFRRFQQQGIHVITKEKLGNVPAETTLWITPTSVHQMVVPTVPAATDTTPAAKDGTAATPPAPVPVPRPVTLPRRFTIVVKENANSVFGSVIRIKEKFEGGLDVQFHG